MVAPAVSSARVRAKRLRRRTEILHAALRAFRDTGYHGTTLDDIARQLGVRKTALYHYFPDKEAILYACHREGLEEVAGLVARARQHPSSAAQLAHLIREHVRVMTDTLEGSSLAFEVSALSPAHRAEVIAARDRYEQALREIVRRGVAAGEVRAVDPQLAVFGILGVINWVARWYSPDGSIHPRALGLHYADHLLRGLLAP